MVREPQIHKEVVEKILDYADSIGFTVLQLDYSPIKGPEGNIEYLVHIEKDQEKIERLSQEEHSHIEDGSIYIPNRLSQTETWKNTIDTIVGKAHASL